MSFILEMVHFYINTNKLWIQEMETKEKICDVCNKQGKYLLMAVIDDDREKHLYCQECLQLWIRLRKKEGLKYLNVVHLDFLK